MRAVTADLYQRAIAKTSLKPKFVRELRPKFDVQNWGERDFIAFTDRAGNRGILWIELHDSIFIVPYALRRGIVDKISGRAKPVICDLCLTQQGGALAARIRFELSPEVSRSLLCCADLLCSLHVRGKTAASLRSKAQLRETISADERVTRLVRRLHDLTEVLSLRPVLTVDT